MFGRRKSYLGVDIGGESIKVVELFSDKGQPRLYTYGVAERKVEQVKQKGKETPEQTATLLRKVCADAKVTSDNVITAMPTFAVFSSIITLPAVSKKEMESAVIWEAKKVVPLPLNEMILDWEELKIKGVQVDNNTEENRREKLNSGDSNKFIRIKKKKEKYKKVLLTAASKSLVRRYVKIFQLAGLNLVSLETESFALSRILIGADKSIIMLVDIGATTTNISIVDRGIPLLNKGIDTGGINVTNLIQQSLGVSFDVAEQFKRDYSHHTFTKRDISKMPESLKISLSPIVDEIKYIVDLFESESQEIKLGDNNIKKGRIDKIILTGGAAYLPYLKEYLSGLMDIKVFIGDPWARVLYPEDLEYLLEEVGPKLSVAIGLAMKNIVS